MTSLKTAPAISHRRSNNGTPMLKALLLLSALISITSMDTVMAAGDASEGSCQAQEYEAMPCRCCKMDCWYTISKSATHELGHIPGEEGEMEALATLKLIRACMISECAALCSTAGAGAGSGLLPPLGSMRNARSGGGGGPKMARGSGRAIRAAGLMKPTGIAAMA